MANDRPELLERAERAMILALRHSFMLESQKARDDARREAADFAAIILAMRKQ